MMFLTHQPEIREKFNPDSTQFIRLTRSIESLDYSEEFVCSTGESTTSIQIERASWVDWDYRGRLVIARDGKIFEGRLDDAGTMSTRELIDLNPSTPMVVRSPDWASKW